MTLKLKTPPMPEPAFKQVGVEQTTNRRVTINNFTEAQLSARDAQWLELVGPVVEALRKMLLWTDPEHDVLERARGEAEAALRAITEEQE